MDPIAHLTQKLLSERARQTTQPQAQAHQDLAPPPPYEEEDSTHDSDDEDEDDEPPLKLTLNAAHSIHGSNNLVPTSPTALSDATHFSTLLLHAVQKLNEAADASPTSKRRLNVELTINCGVTIVGNRNVVGNVSLKPKGSGEKAGVTAAGAEVQLGAKRKADEVSIIPLL